MTVPAQRTRILVVDDERLNRELLQAVLQAEGFAVDSATSGEDCLARLDVDPPDLALLDVLMPGIGGLETCRRIRERRDLLSVPVVFVTALADRDSRVAGKAAGCDDFLTKPIDESELLARVANLVKVKAWHDLQARYRVELEREVERKTETLRRAFDDLSAAHAETRRFQVEAIARLALAAECRDDETGQHVQRMSHVCALIARHLGLDEAACERLLVASPMHDVGKLGTPDRVLLKPGPLDADEWQIMKQHTVLGHRILAGSGSALLDLAATIALTHHERWDGTGYPRGLAGEAIPLPGRIAAVADVFDALTSPRVYKPAFPLDRAIEVMREGRGRHFDPPVLDALLDHLDEALAIRERFADRDVVGTHRAPPASSQQVRPS